MEKINGCLHLVDILPCMMYTRNKISICQRDMFFTWWEYDSNICWFIPPAPPDLAVVSSISFGSITTSTSSAWNQVGKSTTNQVKEIISSLIEKIEVTKNSRKPNYHVMFRQTNYIAFIWIGRIPACPSRLTSMVNKLETTILYLGVGPVGWLVDRI